MPYIAQARDRGQRQEPSKGAREDKNEPEKNGLRSRAGSDNRKRSSPNLLGDITEQLTEQLVDRGYGSFHHGNTHRRRQGRQER